MRTSVYVDGFNLYYGALKNTPYKWLDIKQLVTRNLQSHNVIQEIKYFTAIVSGKIDPNQPTRQKAYIRALKAYTPELSVFYGHFMSNPTRQPLYPITNPMRFASILKTEEKGSDVNLAVHLLNDAWLDKFDCAILISNDSDMAESLRLVKKQTSKLVGLISPLLDKNRNPSRELRKHSNFVRRISKKNLRLSQLPNPIPGTTIHKPTSW